MKKYFAYTPLLIITLGILAGWFNYPGKDFAYWFGTGLGLLLAAAVPSVVIGSIHFLVVRNKKKQVHHLELEVLDEAEQVDKKYTWYYLFCLYLFGIGLFFMVILLSTEK